METSSILVTGGAGFIGSHLVDGLIAAGHRVRILDSLADEVHGGAEPAHLNRDAEFIHASTGQTESCKRAVCTSWA